MRNKRGENEAAELRRRSKRKWDSEDECWDRWDYGLRLHIHRRLGIEIIGDDNDCSRQRWKRCTLSVWDCDREAESAGNILARKVLLVVPPNPILPFLSQSGTSIVRTTSFQDGSIFWGSTSAWRYVAPLSAPNPERLKLDIMRRRGLIHFSHNLDFLFQQIQTLLFFFIFSNACIPTSVTDIWSSERSDIEYKKRVSVREWDIGKGL